MAFGDNNPFGGSSSSSTTTSSTTARPTARKPSGGGGGGGGLGGGRRKHKGGGGGGKGKKKPAAAAAAAAPAGIPAGVNPLDTAIGELAFEDDDNLLNSAWGQLNAVGVNRSNPFGGNAVPWLDQQTNVWADEHRGNLLTGNHLARFDDALATRAGVANSPLIGHDNWVKNIWGPAMKGRLTRDWAGQTAATRGYDSTRWVAPKRTIQF